MWTITGPSSRRCDGATRRSFLQAGFLGLAGLGLADFLRAQAGAAAGGRPPGKTAVILFWLDGGPSHIDTYDPKPAAPAEYRGQFRAIATAVPGIRISELLPEQARMMAALAIVRSIHHRAGDHINGPHMVLTGYYGSNVNSVAPMYPSAGSITARVRGGNRPGMPPYVVIPRASSFNGMLRPGYHGAAYLGVAYNPFDAGDDPNSPGFRVPNLRPAGNLSLAALEDRRHLLRTFNQVRRRLETGGLMEGMDRFDQQAFEMITGRAAREAFDLSREDPRVRDRYGRTPMGQSALLARRLVEAGVTFVTINDSGWDHHGGIFSGLRAKAPAFDRALAALVQDLADRGLADRVLVVALGEFGRTPRVNASAGRDHWPDAQAVVLAGAVRTGRVVGATNARGESPRDRPLGPGDLLATVYHVLGIDPDVEFLNQSGRPIKVLATGRPIAELI